MFTNGLRTDAQLAGKKTDILQQLIASDAVAAPAQYRSQVISRSCRKSSSQVTRVHFFLKKVDDLFLVVALKTQAANAVSPSK